MRSALALATAVGAIAVAALLYGQESAEPEPESAPKLAPPHASATPAPIPPDHMPPPFEDRKVEKPDPAAPLPPETAAFCDDRNWRRLDLAATRSADAEYRIDEAAWNRALASAKTGLASWMSQCHQGGGPVTIVADSTGRRLATYDPQSGLHMDGP